MLINLVDFLFYFNTNTNIFVIFKNLIDQYRTSLAFFFCPLKIVYLDLHKVKKSILHLKIDIIIITLSQSLKSLLYRVKTSFLQSV